MQMTTDTALGVSKNVVHDKSKCSVFIFLPEIYIIQPVLLDKIPYVVHLAIPCRELNTNIILVARITQPSDLTRKRVSKCPSVRWCLIPPFIVRLIPYPGYIEDKKEPLLPPGMRELLHEDLNKSFDF
jgi:Predicted SAM-dependent RNA methyltransferase